MENKKLKWTIKEIAPGMVKLGTESLSKIPTLNEYKQKIMELLSGSEIEKLKDEGHPDISESLALYRELKEDKSTKAIHVIAFSHQNGDVMVNIKNIDTVFETLQSTEQPQKPNINMYGANNDILEEVIRDF